MILFIYFKLKAGYSQKIFQILLQDGRAYVLD